MSDVHPGVAQLDAPDRAPSAIAEHPWSVEVYHTGGLVNGLTLAFFFDDEPSAAEVYDALNIAWTGARARKNDAPDTVEIADVLGRSTIESRNISGLRVFNRATLGDWNWRMALEARAAARSTEEPEESADPMKDQRTDGSGRPTE